MLTRALVFLSASLALVPIGCGARVVADTTGDAGRGDPQQIVRISGAGANTCALRRSGSVVCWGRSFGASPAPLGEVDDAVAIAIGAQIGCVLREGGRVACTTLGESVAPAPPVDLQ